MVDPVQTDDPRDLLVARLIIARDRVRERERDYALRDVGLYRVSWQGEPGPTDVVSGSRASRVYAANLLSPSESDVGTLTELDLGSRNVTATDRTAEKRREYWPWLLLAALAIMMLEWYIFNRKVHI